MCQHLRFPGLCECLHRRGLTRSVIEGIDFGKNRIEKPQSDTLGLELGDCGEHHRSLDANCLIPGSATSSRVRLAVNLLVPDIIGNRKYGDGGSIMATGALART
jgi:hypothetical protein